MLNVAEILINFIGCLAKVFLEVARIWSALDLLRGLDLQAEEAQVEVLERPVAGPVREEVVEGRLPDLGAVAFAAEGLRCVGRKLGSGMGRFRIEGTALIERK